MKKRNAMFEKVVGNYYGFLRNKMKQYLPRDIIEDVVNDSILNFYKYHHEKFDMEYGNQDEAALFRRARNYFLKRIFWYINKKGFYGKKIQEELKRNKTDEMLERGNIENMFYSANSSFEESEEIKSHIKSASYIISNKFNEMIIEDTIWLNQFKRFVFLSRIRELSKKKILKFLETFDKKVFGTNSHHYYSILKQLKTDFDIINA